MNENGKQVQQQNVTLKQLHDRACEFLSKYGDLPLYGMDKNGLMYSFAELGAYYNQEVQQRPLFMVLAFRPQTADVEDSNNYVQSMAEAAETDVAHAKQILDNLGALGYNVFNPEDIKEIEKRLMDMNKVIEDQRKFVRDKHTEIEGLQSKIRGLEATINVMNAQNDELRSILKRYQKEV